MAGVKQIQPLFTSCYDRLAFENLILVY